MKRYSSVWAVVPEVLAMLRDASWDSIPQVAGGVKVSFGAMAVVPAGEHVVVDGLVRRAGQDIVTGGTPGKDDTPETTISVFTNVPGFDAERTWERLTALGCAIDDVFRDLDTGKPIISAALTAAGVWAISLSTVSTSVQPMNSPGAAGWLGVAELVVAWKARI